MMMSLALLATIKTHLSPTLPSFFFFFLLFTFSFSISTTTTATSAFSFFFFFLSPETFLPPKNLITHKPLFGYHILWQPTPSLATTFSNQLASLHNPHRGRKRTSPKPKASK
ncbi:hypothetical protein BCR41DRAFT_355828 [Lobosporangium transversale]|uniref:Uncharacterized protein n=1 Tax=Lobosporangium transversale TaxID=64571 RepID=A0A1Y2GJH8_9FUNG|nr:hypothetical protein BCR41DRAFT_355828 [Lobosporangium transversale]ORZ12878.1 hypothetical protein BCR41DRAFT_355828 [Lobosporangium transversale]|eukprot:XP_021880227.1 hypothetical protein BCR41DRAFT_355828 [Lobosporangium transversale]